MLWLSQANNKINISWILVRVNYVYVGYSLIKKFGRVFLKSDKNIYKKIQ